MPPRRIALFICSLLLLGCSQYKRELCYTSDWYGLGKADGKRGASIHKFTDYVKACREFNIHLDRVSYDRGHQDGLQIYCQPLNGYKEGKKGISYLGGCPVEWEKDFIDAYRRGVLFKEYQPEYISNGERILRLQADLDELDANDPDRLPLTKVLNKLTKRQEEIRQSVGYPPGSELVIPDFEE